MRTRLGAVLVSGLLLGLGSPAQVLVIDDLSGGSNRGGHPGRRD